MEDLNPYQAVQQLLLNSILCYLIRTHTTGKRGGRRGRRGHLYRNIAATRPLKYDDTEHFRPKRPLAR